MAVPWAKKKLLLGQAEVCWPSDTGDETLVKAYGRKLQTYDPIWIALQKYTASGSWWTAQVFLLEIGAWGLVHDQLLHFTL